jgi:hypothetical protein
MQAGFQAVFLLAALVYLAGFLVLRTQLRRPADNGSAEPEPAVEGGEQPPVLPTCS